MKDSNGFDSTNLFAGKKEEPKTARNKASELIQKGKEYKEKKEKLAYERQSKFAEEQCTFKPKLQAKYKSSKLEDRSPDKRKPDQIFEELYKKKEKKSDVRTEDVEYSRNVAECTFKPDIKNSVRRATKYVKTLDANGDAIAPAQLARMGSP